MSCRLLETAPIGKCHPRVTSEAVARVLVKAEPENLSTKVGSERAVRELAKVIAADIVVQALPKKVSTVVDTFSTAHERAKMPAPNRDEVVQAIVGDAVRS
jgi:hypothetical protein